MDVERASPMRLFLDDWHAGSELDQLRAYAVLAAVAKATQTLDPYEPDGRPHKPGWDCASGAGATLHVQWGGHLWPLDDICMLMVATAEREAVIRRLRRHLEAEDAAVDRALEQRLDEASRMDEHMAGMTRVDIQTRAQWATALLILALCVDTRAERVLFKHNSLLNEMDLTPETASVALSLRRGALGPLRHYLLGAIDFDQFRRALHMTLFLGPVACSPSPPGTHATPFRCDPERLPGADHKDILIVLDDPS